MDRQSPDSSLLKRMVHEGNYSWLHQFEDNAQWSQLSHEECELLGQLFIWRGRDQLSRGEENALESFRLAERVAEGNANVYYWQGAVWLRSAQKGGHERHIAYACDKLKQSVQLNPANHRAHHSLGVALMHLGQTYSEVEAFGEAGRHFVEAARIWPEREKGVQQLYWDWGLCLSLFGHFSGEAVDYRRAIDAFEQAAAHKPQEAAFWLQYGDTVSALSRLVNQPEMLHQALGCYLKATQIEGARGEGWFALATTRKSLYESSGDEGQFFAAEECFVKATTALPQRQEIWIAWAALLLEMGRRREDRGSVEKALQKLQRSEEWTSLEAEGQALRVQLLLALGALDESLDILSEAERVARETLARYPDSADLWCCLGDGHVALAGYFAAPERYQSGVEKYLYALSLNPDCLPAFIGLAEAHFAHGILDQNLESFESCCKWCEDALAQDRSAAHLWGMWGMALLRIGEIADRKSAVEEAVQKLCHAVSLHGGVEGSPELDWLFHLGTGLDFLGTFGDEPEYHSQAVDILHRVLERQPNDPLVRFQLGLAYLHLAELLLEVEPYEKAAEQFALIVQQDPDEDIAWDEWGCVLLGLAELLDDLPTSDACDRLRREAEEKFSRAIMLGNADSYYHLAWLHCQSGDYALAVHCLIQARDRGALPPPEDLFNDERLGDLRDSDSFGDFLGN